MHIYKIVGIAQYIHAQLGRGLEEAIYQEVFEIELELNNISFESQKHLHTYYKGKQLSKTYIADIYSDGIVIELKSVSNIISEHRLQLMNYMRIAKVVKGLLINFGEKSLRVERYIYQEGKDDFILLSEKNINFYVQK